MDSLIEFDGVSFSHDGHPLFADLHLRLRPGERLGLVGAMGSGKTTLLHLAVGLLKPCGGVVRAFGVPRAKESDFLDVRRRVGLVFQDSDDQLFCPTVLEDVAFGPLNLGQSAAQAKEAAGEALGQVGMAGFENRVTYRLSGGEKRLVALATVLAMKPEVLLLDEPQNGLDSNACERIKSLLNSLPQSMIIVSHDRDFLPAVATRSLRLENGIVTEA